VAVVHKPCQWQNRGSGRELYLYSSRSECRAGRDRPWRTQSEPYREPYREALEAAKAVAMAVVQSPWQWQDRDSGCRNGDSGSGRELYREPYRELGAVPGAVEGALQGASQVAIQEPFWEP